MAESEAAAPDACACRPALAGVPGTREARAWLWSQRNPPEAYETLLVGKWLLFPNCDQACGDWHIVTQAIHEGRLSSAKISPKANVNGHVICVYTASFENWADVETVARRLDELGLIRRPISYKPDVFTYALIYRHASIYGYRPNQWRMYATPGLDRARELVSNPKLMDLSPGELAKRWQKAPPASSQPPLC
jgi:hypothetical protein